MEIASVRAPVRATNAHTAKMSALADYVPASLKQAQDNANDRIVG